MHFNVGNHVNIMEMAFTFVVKFMICGYQIQKNPVLGQEISFVREMGNFHDPTAIIIKK